jgi:regulatory protein
MRAGKPRRAPRPLDEAALRELAVAYVGRFATTRAKLRSYLSRKIRERGWNGAQEPDLVALADRLAGQGFIDDAGYAEAKARSLTARGYGRRRVAVALRGAGIAEQDGAEALRRSEEEAVASALRFAERRRIGPFAAAAADPKAREKAIAAMVRSGHSFSVARAIVTLEPGARIDPDDLADAAGRC